MADPTPPRLGAEGLVDRVLRLEEKVRGLQAPSGTQRVSGVDQLVSAYSYLAALQSYGDTNNGATLATTPNDGLNKWYAVGGGLEVLGFECRTGQCLVTVSAGEFLVQPQGGTVSGMVSFQFRDANAVTIPGFGLAQNVGRMSSNARLGMSLSTGPTLVSFDPAIYPPPYEVRAYPGTNCSAANTSTVTCVVTDMTLRIEVIGNGVDSLLY